MTEQEENQMFAKAFYQTWDQIYPDVLVDENGEFSETVQIDKEEVCEMVTDASRPVICGLLSNEDYERYTNFSQERKNRILLLAFPNETYCA